MAKYDTEKRMANVGERILITNAALTGGKYANGDIANVKTVLGGGVKVEEFSLNLFHSEYEVIVDNPLEMKKSARITALETQVAALQAKVEALEATAKYPLTERFERESAEVDGILADIKRKAKPTLEALLATYPSQQTRILSTPNQLRWGTIQRAKAFVAKALSRNYGVDATPKMVKSDLTVWFSGAGGYAVTDKAEFIVDSEKRTVVALIKTIIENDVVLKGIAKCDPDDVFNADIGKAIALARALGVEVPVEFVKAVQPTEVVVGQRIYYTSNYPNLLVCDNESGEVGTHIRIRIAHGNPIIDDTDAVYE